MFLLASIWAAVAMILWVLAMAGTVTLPTNLSEVDWHVHELLYGYLPAVIAGFLLTAVPNWTGRLPVTGKPLLFLALVWLAGRIVVLISDYVGPTAAAGVDLSFLAALAFLVGREIIAGRNWRNLKVLLIVFILLFGNGAFHLQAAGAGVASGGLGARVGLAAAVSLIMLIGGRIVPSFTRNWLARENPGRRPIPFNRFDSLCLAVAAVTLAFWVAAPERSETALLCLLAGGLQLWRLARWAGHRTLAEPLVLILHVGYLFIPIGFLLIGTSALVANALPPSAALHAWTAGAVGVMTIAVMTRASLGHTGRLLHATPGVVWVYASVVVSAVLRIFAGMGLASDLLLLLAAVGWVAAFAGFAVLFWPMLARPRIESPGVSS